LFAVVTTTVALAFRRFAHPDVERLLIGPLRKSAMRLNRGGAVFVGSDNLEWL
jgi:hypothetical protein